MRHCRVSASRLICASCTSLPPCTQWQYGIARFGDRKLQCRGDQIRRVRSRGTLPLILPLRGSGIMTHLTRIFRCALLSAFTHLAICTKIQRVRHHRRQRAVHIRFSSTGLPCAVKSKNNFAAAQTYLECSIRKWASSFAHARAVSVSIEGGTKSRKLSSRSFCQHL